MKKSRYSILVFTFIILASIIGSISISRGTAHDIEMLNQNEFYITDAYYDDFDSDGHSDDIRVIAVLDIDVEDEIASYLFLDIYLPSGFCFHFYVNVEFEANGHPIEFIFTTYNTALENGWYTAKLTGFFVTDDDLYVGRTNMTFDPPAEDGSGDPTITVSLVYRDD